ncbi:Yos1-like protein, partial [Prunus dulcis]
MRSHLHLQSKSVSLRSGASIRTASLRLEDGASQNSQWAGQSQSRTDYRSHLRNTVLESSSVLLNTIVLKIHQSDMGNLPNGSPVSWKAEALGYCFECVDLSKILTDSIPLVPTLINLEQYM